MIIILDDNQLDDISNSDKANQAMLNGRLYDADTMNQVYPVKDEREKFYVED